MTLPALPLALCALTLMAMGCTPSGSRVAIRSDCNSAGKPPKPPWLDDYNGDIGQVPWDSIARFVGRQGTACFDRSKGRIDKEVRDRDTWLRADIVPAARLSELTMDELRQGRFIGYVSARNKGWKKFGIGRHESLVWVDGRGQSGGLRFVFVEARERGNRPQIPLFYTEMTQQVEEDADFRRPPLPGKETTGDSGAMSTMARVLVEDEAWFRCTSNGCCCTTANCH